MGGTSRHTRDRENITPITKDKDNPKDGHNRQLETVLDFLEEHNTDECKDQEVEEQGKVVIVKFDNNKDESEDRVYENINKEGMKELKEEEAKEWKEWKVEDRVQEEHSGMVIYEQPEQEVLEANKDLELG